MKFLAEGPSIPDELLIARDEGRVIFFCGAGVSRARAQLLDFFGLAEQVVEVLGISADDPVRKLIDEAGQLERRTGIPGLISADRIFGLLERNFHTKDIEEAVAKALKPKQKTDLSAHRIMLDLARSPEGTIRLVTTNFDLLFEACDRSLPKHRNPRLPDPNHPEDFEGIIHMHGHVDNDYQGASGDGFVLSSSEFGDAYLADGWATRFIRSILEKFLVVFVGYTADDPPVHYLLEALNKRSNSLQKMYAFQEGSQNDAEARWRHKGVTPISFDSAQNYKSLWDTLSAWAERAVNLEAWYEKIIDMARKGPEALQPHERGQVAHLVSSLEGARRFAGSENPPPAEWLCVFDPAMRYLKPGHLGTYLERGPFFDPFEAYGLESDPVPAKIDPEDYHAKREVPSDVWNCFSPATLDLHNLQIGNYAALRGGFAVNVPNPPPRLLIIGHWLCKVSEQPAAIWWAAHQAGIHPEIQSRILFALERMKETSSPVIRKAWRYLIEGWKKGRVDTYQKWFQLKASIDLDGWSDSAIRDLADIFRPCVKIEWPYWGGPKPPDDKTEIQLSEMIKLTVEYPELHETFEIPDAFLVTAVREFRKNLEYAVSLEKELDEYWYLRLSPIEPDPSLGNDSFDRHHGISLSFLKYVELFERLLFGNPAMAKRECQTWWVDDDNVFARLRIWAAGKPEMLNGSEAGRLMCNLADAVFWKSCHQRDIMLTMSRRWNSFSPAIRKRLEKRLLRGDSRWNGEQKPDYVKRRAWDSLSRIHWLKDNGCHIDSDIIVESEKLCKVAPQWQPQYAAKAAASMEMRSGCVGTNTEFTALLTEPLDTLLSNAKELSGRMSESLVENDPFTGLATSRPVRALSALGYSAKRGEFPEWAWRKFLYSQVRENNEKDKPRFSRLVAQRISRLPDQAIAGLIHPVSNWLLKASKTLLSCCPEQFEQMWAKTMSVLRSEPDISKTALVRGNKEPAWVTEALNAPAGKLAQAVMNDPKIDGLKAGYKFPSSWTNRVEELLGLRGDHRRYALVMFTHNLNWFYAIDPAWTENNLLPTLDRDDEDQAAFWDGFLWGGKCPNEPLYLRLKPHLLVFSRTMKVDRSRLDQVLSAILLAGWGSKSKNTGERLITSEEMRNIILHADDEFRGQMIWYLEKWAGNEAKRIWTKNLPVFFTEAWPRQKQTKSPKMSAKLCDLAFTNKAIFAAIAEIILPLVTNIDEDGVFLPHLRKTKDEVVGKYPEKVLALLWAVLPLNAAKWPYGVDEILTIIGDAKPSLLKDKHLIELKRRWNVR
jgi:hypothetical protein